MYNVKKMAKHAFKILRCEHRKVFKAYLVIFQHYTFKGRPTKWSNTIKQLVGKLPTNCFSVFDHSVGLAPKGLCIKVLNLSVVLHYVIATRWQSNMIKKSYDANHLEL